MPDRPSTLPPDAIQAFLDESRRVITSARIETSGGSSLLPSPPRNTPPGIDTRTVTAAITTFAELGDYPAARALASFFLAVQNPSGAWVQAYRQDATESASSADEDVTALVVWALMRYVRASGDDVFAEQAREHVELAAEYTRARRLNPYLYLVETTGSIHGPEVSQGYELWTNCAHASAFALCHRVYAGERFRRLALLIRRAIGLLMTADGRFVRRLDPSGYPDPRPDVCLVAPAYFGLWPATERMVMNSAELVESTLWNVEMGGYVRYLPYSAAEREGPFGPSPCYSAWMAQYHYELGNKDRAEAIMRWLFDNATAGQLAEVLVPPASTRRYLPEQRRLLAGVASDSSDNSRNQRLLADLETVERSSEPIVPLGVPMVWAHLETLRALRRGGYLETWQLDSAPSVLPDEDPVRE